MVYQDAVPGEYNLTPSPFGQEIYPLTLAGTTILPERNGTAGPSIVTITHIPAT